MRRPYLFGVRRGHGKAAAPGSAAAKMLMCGKATRKNLTGARPLFRRMKMAFRMESVLDIMGLARYFGMSIEEIFIYEEDAK